IASRGDHDFRGVRAVSYGRSIIRSASVRLLEPDSQTFVARIYLVRNSSHAGSSLRGNAQIQFQRLEVPHLLTIQCDMKTQIVLCRLAWIVFNGSPGRCSLAPAVRTRVERGAAR